MDDGMDEDVLNWLARVRTLAATLYAEQRGIQITIWVYPCQWLTN